MTLRLTLIVLGNIFLNISLVWLVWRFMMARKPSGGQPGNCEWWHSAGHLNLVGDLQRVCQQVRLLEEHFRRIKNK